MRIVFLFLFLTSVAGNCFAEDVKLMSEVWNKMSVLSKTHLMLGYFSGSENGCKISAYKATKDEAGYDKLTRACLSAVEIKNERQWINVIDEIYRQPENRYILLSGAALIANRILNGDSDVVGAMYSFERKNGYDFYYNAGAWVDVDVK